jgi:hypothetical protein
MLKYLGSSTIIYQERVHRRVVVFNIGDRNARSPKSRYQYYRLARPPAGIVPRKTIYFFMPIHPSGPVTLTVIVLLPNGKLCVIACPAGQLPNVESGDPSPQWIV